MKYTTLIFCFISAFCYSQDSLILWLQKEKLQVPLDGQKIIYERISAYDSSYSADQIFKQIKPAISDLFVTPGIGSNSALFHTQNIREQVISEDIEGRSIYANIMFSPKKLPNEPKEIKRKGKLSLLRQKLLLGGIE